MALVLCKASDMFDLIQSIQQNWEAHDAHLNSTEKEVKTQNSRLRLTCNFMMVMQQATGRVELQTHSCTHKALTFSCAAEQEIALTAGLIWWGKHVYVHSHCLSQILDPRKTLNNQL